MDPNLQLQRDGFELSINRCCLTFWVPAAATVVPPVIPTIDDLWPKHESLWVVK